MRDPVVSVVSEDNAASLYFEQRAWTTREKNHSFIAVSGNIYVYQRESTTPDKNVGKNKAFVPNR